MVSRDRKNSEFVKLRIIDAGVYNLKQPYEEQIDPEKVEAIKAIIDAGVDIKEGFTVEFNASFTKIRKRFNTGFGKQELGENQFDINEKFEMSRAFQKIKLPAEKKKVTRQSTLTYE